ncbi:CDP-diacylglycerol--serine O-phosphatidyltransferase [Endomicrobium proavitum]|uniref:CDP-diacylglycerol--serine O-phosphatidyltransferase n=1 Tax=Endomicrobium proavitum TaxID=1408281 RepID=A0A0G3WK51_9BACT|nr:CDP-diacylglycerol--serine O-phosphatidyltransferase [Endomicrobium proavitum]AKL97879.1 CDP-diacylglycerol--serine O-phosphatidyltransferase [Endomicrobium proavitum]
MKTTSLKKGIYILPSLFTCGNMTFGFLSMLSSVSGHFTQAAWLLICSIACDMLDGRVARMTKTTSEFGVQLDSLSDLISFGLAPAIMIYMLGLKDMGKIGIAIAVLFVLCSALRLAKFNVKAQDGVVHSSFSGLPTPASAGLLISFVLSFELLNTGGQSLTFKSIPLLMNTMPTFFNAMPVVMVVLSLLMVSNIPFASFKKMKLSKPQALQVLVIIIVLLVIVIVYPQNTFFILFSLYVLSGVVIYALKYLNRVKNYAKRKTGKRKRKHE